MTRRTTRSADPVRRSVWRGRLWVAAVGAVAFLGMVHGRAQGWGKWSWFQSELVAPPIVGWQNSSLWVEGVGLALFGWSLVVLILATEDIRPRWVWSWGGLAIVVLISLGTSLVASRNGVALYKDRVVWRQGIFSELQTSTSAEMAGLNVSCEMVRRYKGLDRDNLVERSVVSLRVKDGRTIALEDGGPGYRYFAYRRHRLLVVIAQLGHLPRQLEAVDPRCVDLVASRFAPKEQPRVRAFMSTDTASRS